MLLSVLNVKRFTEIALCVFKTEIQVQWPWCESTFSCSKYRHVVRESLFNSPRLSLRLFLSSPLTQNSLSESLSLAEKVALICFDHRAKLYQIFLAINETWPKNHSSIRLFKRSMPDSAVWARWVLKLNAIYVVYLRKLRKKWANGARNSDPGSCQALSINI